MEVKIRNVDPMAVKRIDEQAKKNNLSRNAYLVKILENLSVNEEIAKTESKYSEAMGAITNVMEVQAKEFSELKELLYLVQHLRSE